jgi:hypothetical protein
MIGAEIPRERHLSVWIRRNGRLRNIRGKNIYEALRVLCSRDGDWGCPISVPVRDGAINNKASDLGAGGGAPVSRLVALMLCHLA